MGLTGCYAIIKYFVFLVNVIFWITGLTIIVLAVWMLTDPTFYVSMAQDEPSYYSGVYLLLIIGSLMFIVGFLGCCGVIKESQCMLVLFFCFLVIILVAEISAGIWAYSNSAQLEELVRENVKITVQQEYGEVYTRTTTFDQIQRGLKCCGANGPSDWAGSRYNKAEKKVIDLAISSALQLYEVPPSCCSVPEDVELCRTATKIGVAAPISGLIYSEGCVDKLLGELQQYMSTIVWIGVFVAFAEILGLAFSLVLCCAIQQRDRYKA